MKHTNINLLLILLSAILFAACSSKTGSEPENTLVVEQLSNTGQSLELSDESSLSKAVFASGCFWCTEAVFERVEGVKEVVSGYAGGTSANPSYKEVSAGRTDHAEAVIVYYDSTKVSYPVLLDIFFHSHDPTQLNRQGPDVGKQYRSAIFYNSPYQQKLAEGYMDKLKNSKEFAKPVVTEIKPLSRFWPAEKYHQDYYKINPNDPYITQVSRPKVKKFEKEYRKYLKKEYQ